MRTKWFVAFSLCLGVPLLGQTLGDVAGRVSDPSGAGVPNSVITLTSTSTNAVRQTDSGSDGFYSLPSIPPGLYTLKAEHPGFKTATSNIEVQVQQSVRLDLTLQVGEVSQSVEVSAAASLLQAENATVGSVVQNQSIVELPLNGREYLNLVTLAPNVSNLAPPSGQAQSRQGGIAPTSRSRPAGTASCIDYYTLDGVVNTDPNFNTYIVLPSIDAIQEFKVQTGVYPAEFGHEATQVNVLTKSGGNAYHGSLFEFVRNNDFDATAVRSSRQCVPAYRPSSGTIMASRSTAPSSFRSSSTAGTNCSSWRTTNGWSNGRAQQAVYSVPTAAMFGGNFSQTGDHHLRSNHP